ncbi:MAG: hypothetical protein M1114_04010 [Candidatus Dependentiae bacterium]|nr:hypothetical protein [Candidatus Dependentiae bacterium]
MILTVKYIVLGIWVLITTPVFILGANMFINDLLPAPKNNSGFFAYLLNSRLFYLQHLIWIVGPWFAIKKELGFVPIAYALQQVGVSLVITTIFLSIKYYRSKHAPQTKLTEESEHQS